MTKYCKDCKWCSYREPNFIQKLFPFLIGVGDWLEYAKCLHPDSKITKSKDYDHLVTGQPTKMNKNDYSYCATMRSIDQDYHRDRYCGSVGRHWEAKDV